MVNGPAVFTAMKHSSYCHTLSKDGFPILNLRPEKLWLSSIKTFQIASDMGAYSQKSSPGRQ